MSAMMRLLKFVAGLATATIGFAASPVFSASAHVPSPEGWIREFFETQHPGTAMRVVTIGNQHEVEICFDQCDIFQRSKLARDDNFSKGKFWEFVFLFEHAKGVGADYEGFREASRAAVADLARRNSVFCRDQTGDDSTPYSCNWHQWAAALRIRIGQATYDEGLRCIAWKAGRALTTQRQRCTKAIESPWNSRR
jgi:hypothetical protein